MIGARWDEINLAEQLWTVPAERMKAGKEHRVPLQTRALAIVEQMAAIRQGDTCSRAPRRAGRSATWRC